MEYINLFEHSVERRIEDVKNAINENSHTDLRPTSLFLGIALGLAASKFAGFF